MPLRKHYFSFHLRPRRWRQQGQRHQSLLISSFLLIVARLSLTVCTAIVGGRIFSLIRSPQTSPPCCRTWTLQTQHGGDRHPVCRTRRGSLDVVEGPSWLIFTVNSVQGGGGMEPKAKCKALPQKAGRRTATWTRVTRQWPLGCQDHLIQILYFFLINFHYIPFFERLPPLCCWFMFPVWLPEVARW